MFFNNKMKELNFKTTKELKISKLIIDQIIGQKQAIKILKKVASQRRNLLLIGVPGTGKSLIGQALAELLPKEKLQDILAFKNLSDENIPLIKVYSKGKGKEIINKYRIQSMSSLRWQSVLFFGLAILAIMSPWWIRREYGDVMAAASLISSMVFLVGLALFINLSKRTNLSSKEGMPKLLIDNSKSDKAPFIDGSGAHSGALFGDCLHDPLQSFSSSTKITKNNRKSVLISLEVNRLLKKHEKELIKKKGYEATYLKKGELYILAEKGGKIQPIEVLSVNKYKSNKPYLIRITTESGKTLTVTPEHKVAVNKNRKIIYKEARRLTKLDKVCIY